MLSSNPGKQPEDTGSSILTPIRPQLEIVQTDDLREGMMTTFHLPSVNGVHITRKSSDLREINEALAVYEGRLKVNAAGRCAEELKEAINIELHKSDFITQFPEVVKLLLSDLSLLIDYHPSNGHTPLYCVLLKADTSYFSGMGGVWQFAQPHVDVVKNNCIVVYEGITTAYYLNSEVIRSQINQVNNYTPAILRTGATPIETETGDVLVIEGGYERGVVHHTMHSDQMLNKPRTIAIIASQTRI